MLKIRKFGSSLILLLVQFLVISFAIMQISPVLAQTENFVPPSAISKVQIDPADNSVWALWLDSNPRDFVISHVDAEGKPIVVFRFPATVLLDDSFLLGMDFTAGAPRLYYYTQVTKKAAPPTERYIKEFDLKNGTVRSIVSHADFQDCLVNITGRHRATFNPTTKHIYIDCFSGTYDNHGKSYFLVIEAGTGKILKKLDSGIIPLVAKPGMPVLYAMKEYRAPANNYPVPTDVYDIITLDINTEEATTDPPIAERLAVNADYLNFFDVAAQSGNAYFGTTCCNPKGSSTAAYSFDKAQNKLTKYSPDTGKIYPYLLNEAAKQLYFKKYYYDTATELHKEAYWLADLQADRVARFDWELLASDTRGLLYGQLNAVTPMTKDADPGLGLVVINPQTFSVLRSISLRAPDKSYANKALRLAALPTNFKGRFFTETGHTLDGKFRDYWEKNGGLARFGYPITEPFVERNPQLNRDLTVQYFERSRFELHDENAGTPYEVLLGALGRNFSATTGPRPVGSFDSGQTIEIAGGVRFRETGHTLTGKFYDYWKVNGGLAQHGLPLTEPTEEINPIDGKRYLVQYFERSRLELHPENAGTQYEVLMGHFGVQLLRARGWNLSF